MSDDVKKYLPTPETLRQRSDSQEIETIQKHALDNPELDAALDAIKPWVRAGEDPLYFSVGKDGKPSSPPAKAAELPAPPRAKPKRAAGRAKGVLWQGALAVLCVLTPVTVLWLWMHRKPPEPESARAVMDVTEAGPAEASAPPAACAPTLIEAASAVAPPPAPSATPAASSSEGASPRAPPRVSPKKPPPADAGATEPAFPPDMLQ